MRNWHAARLEAERSGNPFALVQDEIQSIPDWSAAVKGLWDADRVRNCPLHVVIVGLAPLLMQSSLGESLAELLLPLPVSHWSYDQTSEAFGLSLDEFCCFGGYPGAAAFRQDQKLWRSYVLQALVAPVGERDVPAMARIDRPALLARLLRLASSFAGQIVAYSDLMGRLHDAGNDTTVARYRRVLIKVGQLAALPQYSGSLPRHRPSSLKLNVLNTALMTAGSGYSFDEARQDRSL